MSLAAIYDVPAPAKLNLFLHVVGRRLDGYHLLQSVLVLIDWCDTLHFERRVDGRLQRHDLGPALPADDLSLRAARALQQASGTSLGADLSVLKCVPWGAGLGGGSSDAASALLALNRLWGLHWPRERLQAIALPLGADIPFFVGGQNAFVEGIGERLTPLSPQVQRRALADRCYAVVKPGPAIATSAIFNSPLLAGDTEPVIVMSFLADAQLGGKLVSGFGRNDLQPPAQASCSELTEVAAWLEARFGNSRMSGSGSAVFARIGKNSNEFQGDLQCTGEQGWLTDTSKETPKETLKETLNNVMPDWVGDLPPGWLGRACIGLDHHPLLGWAD